MNVLYLGPYYSNTSHGHSSRYFIRELAKKCSLTTRAVNLYPDNLDTDEFAEYEGQQDSFDIIIQDVPPYQLDYEGSVKNIVIARQSTQFNYYSTSLSRLSMMDEIWCLNNCDVHNVACWLNTPTKLYRIKYDEKNKEDPNLDISNPGDSFIFGWIGEPFDKDDLTSFLIAFHTTFHPSEPVAAVINVRNPQRAAETINQIKRRLRLYSDVSRYNKETITTLPFQDVWRLESVIDCLVRTTRGESYNRFTHDFFASGKPVIAPDVGSTFGTLVETPVYTYSIPCICDDSPYIDLYTARESWRQIDLTDLSNKMRDIYERRPKHDRNIKSLNEEIEDITL